MRRRVPLHCAGDLPHGGGRLLGVLGGSLGLPRGLGVLAPEFPLLHPPGKGVLPPQLGVVPEGGLPRQLRPVLGQSAFRPTRRPEGLGAQAALVPTQEPACGPLCGKFALMRRLHRHILVLHFPEFAVELHHRCRFQRVPRLGGERWSCLLGLNLLLEPQTAADSPGVGVILLLQMGAAFCGKLGLCPLQPPSGLFHPPLRPLIPPLLAVGRRRRGRLAARVRGADAIFLKP